jgi:hypothetical protein
MDRRLLHPALPITKADAMFVGQASGWETAVLQYEMTIPELVTFDPSFGEK